MNRSRLHLLFVLYITSTLFAGCDKISEPYLDEAPPLDTTATTPLEGRRKALVEDYTGHQCGNCPEAAIAAEQLKQLYDTQVVVMAVHAGFFAQVRPSGKYTYDFNTAAGTAWDTDFGISNAGNPNGMVNRVGFPTSQHIKAYSDWSGLVATDIAKKAEVNIGLKTTFDTTSRNLTTDVNLLYFNTPSTEWKLVVALTEDSIVNWQKDYSKPSGQQDISNYMHRHVLRTTLNDKYGDAIIPTGIVAGTKQTKTYTLTLNQQWKFKHCAIVAFIYNAQTKEVVQVQEKKIH
jgi:hypothetical protein